MIRKKSFYKKTYIKKYQDGNKYPTIETLEDELFEAEKKLEIQKQDTFMRDLTFLVSVFALSMTILLNASKPEDKIVLVFLGICFITLLLSFFVLRSMLFTFGILSTGKQEIKIECIKESIVQRKNEMILKKTKKYGVNNLTEDIGTGKKIINILKNYKNTIIGLLLIFAAICNCINGEAINYLVSVIMIVLSVKFGFAKLR